MLALKYLFLFAGFATFAALPEKVQMKMAPSDGEYFFANDVLRGATTLGSQPVAPQ